MFRAVTALFLLSIATLGLIAEARAERRVALVIGNSEYRHTVALQNPRNDAADVAAALGRLGFTVIEGIDLDKGGMERRIREFASALEGADVGLFFYAGHGLQVDGKNFLAPVDATLKSETDLDFEAVRLNLVTRQLERHARLSLVFLDACRDNPMATTLARSLKGRSRSVSVGRGLARVEKAVGMMIAFATQPGNVALDGKGRNSPFTQALLKNIESEGSSIGDTMIEVRNDVIAATDGKQVPWENSSLTGKFYFKPGSGDRPKMASATPDQPDVHNTTFDHTFWTSIRDSDDAALYAEYLKRFPDGVFTPIARAKLESLRSVKGEVKQASLPAKDDATVSDAEKGASAIDMEAVKLQLVRDTQTALKGIGCYTGKIDGNWGSGSRAAMGRFNRVAHLGLPLEPSASILDVIKSWTGRHCTVVTKKRIEPRRQPKQVKRSIPKKEVKRRSPTRQAKRSAPAQSKKKRAAKPKKRKRTARSKAPRSGGRSRPTWITSRGMRAPLPGGP